MNAEQIIKDICKEVGVTINGPKPWDPQIQDERFYARVLAQGSLGLGETWMLGWWDVEDLYEFFQRILSMKHLDEWRRAGWRTKFEVLRAKITNVQSVDQSRELADAHYNLSNALFEAMLGPSMAYSCGYWKTAETLDDAQYAKFDLICRKLDLKPGERLLDIGCGWGSFARYAAQEYGVEVVGLTVANEQAGYARTLCGGLPVDIVCCDYREFDHNEHGGTFDKAVSIGMVEHVGAHNYRKLFEMVARALKARGLFVLHSIGSSVSLTSGDPWISKYIFPGGMLPSVRQLSEAAEELMVLHDAHNIGIHYTPTLRAWHDRFETWWSSQEANTNLPRVWGATDTFHRMWRYYLLSCAADFSVGDSQVWQFVYAKGHLPDGYACVR